MGLNCFFSDQCLARRTQCVLLDKYYFEDTWCTEFTWSSTSRRPTTMQTKHKESLAANGESGIKSWQSVSLKTMAMCF